jgi:hypothetical protein
MANSDPSRPLSRRGGNGSSCPKAAIQRSTDGGVRQVSKLSFVAPRSPVGQAEACHFQAFPAKEVVKARVYSAKHQVVL